MVADLAATWKKTLTTASRAPLESTLRYKAETKVECHSPFFHLKSYVELQENNVKWVGWGGEILVSNLKGASPIFPVCFNPPSQVAEFKWKEECLGTFCCQD